MSTEDELRAAQDEIVRLREVMGLLGMTDLLPEDGPGSQPDDEATEQEIARILGLPAQDASADELPAVTGPGTAGPAAAPRTVAPVVDLPVGRPRRRRWVTVTAGAAAAALIAVGATVLPQLGTESAVADGSPPMLALPIAAADLAAGAGDPAEETLLELAQQASAQTDPEPGGDVQHSLSQSWLMSTEVTDEGTTTTIDPTVVESWLAPDGSMVSAEWRGAALEADGQLEAVDTSPDEAAVDRFPAGTFDADAVTGLSTDPAVLRTQLLDRLPGLDCTGDAEPYCLYLALTDLSDRYVVPSATEAALWTMLAEAPGVTVAGEVTDRTGRRSIAISVPGGPTDTAEVVRVLLVDATTGRLSGREEVTISSEVLGITEPTVTQFRYNVTSDRVAEVGGPASDD
ncbi:MAG TPA: CU044_5270 family protein [Cellulomonas sp.]